jgi:hypothetical protein
MVVLVLGYALKITAGMLQAGGQRRRTALLLAPLDFQTLQHACTGSLGYAIFGF